MIDAKKLKEEILEELRSKYPEVVESVKIGYRVQNSKVYLKLRYPFSKSQWILTKLDSVVNSLNEKNNNHHVLWLTSSLSRIDGMKDAVFRVYDLLDKDCPAWVRKYA